MVAFAAGSDGFNPLLLDPPQLRIGISAEVQQQMTVGGKKIGIFCGHRQQTFVLGAG